MMQYENRMVLFLDILGFQKIIDETVDKQEDKHERIEKLYNSLLLIKAEVSKENGTSKVVTQFSDSIVVSFRQNDSKEFISFFQGMLSLLIKLIKQDIICRGAISLGKLIHNDEIVFGPALNDAYLTESTASLYPRVILDRSIVENLKFKYKAQTQDMISRMRFDSGVWSTLNVDSDDKLYIDYFTGALALIHDPSILEYFTMLRKFIIAGQRYVSPSVKIKYGWMKNKFNRFLDELHSIQNEHNLNYKYLNQLAQLEKIK
jgi:hypothetical protein